MEVNDIGWIDYRILELVYMRVEWIIQLYCLTTAKWSGIAIIHGGISLRKILLYSFEW